MGAAQNEPYPLAGAAPGHRCDVGEFERQRSALFYSVETRHARIRHLFRACLLDVCREFVSGCAGASCLCALARFYAEGRRRAFIFLLLKLLGIGTILGAGGIIVAWIA